MTASSLAPPNRGHINSNHVLGTHLPVEEPSTASTTDIVCLQLGGGLVSFQKFRDVRVDGSRRLTPDFCGD